MYIDTHCHISKNYYDDINEVITDSKNNGLEKIIISCCAVEDIEESLNIINNYDNVYATFGYHPDQIDKVCDEDFKKLETLIKTNQKIVGIGEIGLDYHYGTDKEKQKRLFKEQLKIAQRLNLPVVIHSRDATKDTIDILKMFNVSGVIHCFSGSLETANIYISMGYKLGIGGVLTFKNSKLYKVIENINLENIVLETDSPYLTPEPYRGKTNSSKYIPIIAKKLAEVKKVSIEEVAKITTNNAYLIFDLK